MAPKEETGSEHLREPVEEFAAWLKDGAAESSVLAELSYQGFLREEYPKVMTKKNLKTNAEAALKAFPKSKAMQAHVEWALMVAK